MPAERGSGNRPERKLLSRWTLGVSKRTGHRVSISRCPVRRVDREQDTPPQTVGPSSESETTGDDNAVHGDSKSQQGIGSRYPARQETSCRHGQVQRGAGEGGRLARGRGSAAKLKGRS